MICSKRRVLLANPSLGEHLPAKKLHALSYFQDGISSRIDRMKEFSEFIQGGN